MIAPRPATFTPARLSRPKLLDTPLAQKLSHAWPRGVALLCLVLCCRNGSGQDFFSVPQVPTEHSVVAATVADLNEDGLADLVTLETDGTLSVYPGTRDGAFAAPTKSDLPEFVPRGVPTLDLILRDLTGDDHVDALLALDGETTLFILEGHENGTFAAGSQIACAEELFLTEFESVTELKAVACGDVDGDGRDDLVCASGPWSDGVRPVVLLEALVAPRFDRVWETSTVAHDTKEIGLPDFDGDGELDLAALFNDSFVGTKVFLGHGLVGGQFSDPLTERPLYDDAMGVTGFTHGDITGNGVPDVLLWGAPAGGLVLCNGKPDVSIAAPSYLPVQSDVTDALFADLDRDGRLDVVSILGRAGLVNVRLGKDDLQKPTSYLATRVEAAGGSVSDITGDTFHDVFLPSSGARLGLVPGNGDGTLDSLRVPTVEGLATTGVLADFDGDDLTDAVALLDEKPQVAFFRGTGAAPWFSDATHHDVATEIGVPAVIAAGDFNGDGRADVVLGHKTSSVLQLLLGQAPGTGFTGAGAFTLPVRSSMKALIPADFNGDGALDLAATLYVSRSVGLLLGQGDGTFAELQTIEVGPTPTGAAVADMDGDGVLDIVVRCGGGGLHNALWILKGTGGGAFSGDVAWEGDIAGTPGTPEPADVNGDGRPDILVPVLLWETEPLAPSLLVFQAQAEGGIGDPLPVEAGPGILSCHAADLDGDRMIDCALATGEVGTIRILKGAGDGTFELEQTLLGGRPEVLVARDLNGDGSPDLGVVGGSVYVLINDATAAVIFRRGDANADGSMNVADAVYVLQNLFANGPAVLCHDAADSNDDEDMNLADAVYILQHLFANGPPVPEPYPQCGADPTPHPHGGPDLPPCDYCPEACLDPPVPCEPLKSW